MNYKEFSNAFNDFLLNGRHVFFEQHIDMSVEELQEKFRIFTGLYVNYVNENKSREAAIANAKAVLCAELVGYKNPSA